MSANVEEGPPPGWRVLEGADADPFQRLNGPFYIADPFERTEEEAARFGFRVAPHNCSFVQGAHGGWIAAILDVSMGKNIHIGLDYHHTPTISLTVDFMRAGIIGDWIESRARILRVTRTLAFADCLLVGPKGPIARANGVFKLPSK